MQVKRSKHTAAFTVVPNKIAQASNLSLTARGLLVLLLSQPEFTAETVKELTAGAPEGQLRVTRAMRELQDAGYIVCTRTQNERGHWSTAVTVSDVPMIEAPKIESPKSGSQKSRISGLIPFGEKNQVKNPPVVPAVEEVAEVPATEATGEGDEVLGKAARVLASLGTTVPALSLKAAEVIRLAPVAAEWLNRGVSESTLKAELSASLPANVKSAAALVANRLERKMPPVPVAVVPLVECAPCGGYLPRGQKTGICGRCAGVEAAAVRPVVGAGAEAAGLLAAIRQRRESGAFAAGAKSRFAN
jgi:hypothetical protein